MEAHAAVLVSPFAGRLGNNSDLDEVVVTGGLSGQNLGLARNAAPAADVGGSVEWSIVQFQ